MFKMTINLLVIRSNLLYNMNNKFEEEDGMMSTEYQQNIAGFEKINSTKAQELIDGEGEAIIYIGKEVCPYCQIFVKKLRKVADETGAHIYHINSIDEEDIEGIMAFRDQYNIPTVPGFIYTNGDQVNVRCDSTMPEEEIKAFMNR